MTGVLVASYTAAQMFSSPLLGRLSDRFGRRPVLMASIFGSFLGFLLLGFAGSLVMLFFARVVDGLTGGNLSVAQAYISDVTDEKNRARGLGMVGGFPQTSLLRARGPRTGLENVWLVGDSVFPGQSTAGVTLGAMRTAAEMLTSIRPD